MNDSYEIDLSNEEGKRNASQQREMYLQNEAAINKEKFELGKQQRNIEIARNAIKMNLDIQSIMKLTGLTENEIESLKSE